MKIIIYLAGPLFTQAERIWNEILAGLLRDKGNDIEIFLPQDKTKNLRNPHEIFNICIEGIDSSDIILAILDGADSDSGTCFECGYAYAKNKKIIGIRTDIRCGEDNGLNIMLSEACTLITFPSINDKNLNDLANVIYEAIFVKKNNN